MDVGPRTQRTLASKHIYTVAGAKAGLTGCPTLLKSYLQVKWVFTFGAPGGIRTPDPLIRSQILYPLSYGRIRKTIFF